MQDEREQFAVRLCQASSAGDEPTAQALLSQRAELVSVFVVEPRDWGDEMWLAIHYAAAAGRVEVAERLLDAGASADSRTRFRTPMHARETPVLLAAKAGHTDMLRLLLERGGSVEVRDANQLSPLSHAAANGHDEAVAVLLDHGAMVDSEDDQQRTPLHHAIRGGHVGVAERLIASGADVNHVCPKEPGGYTPLHRCVSAGPAMLSVAEKLIACGADAGLADPRFGRTAGDLAGVLGAAVFQPLLSVHRREG